MKAKTKLKPFPQGTTMTDITPEVIQLALHNLDADNIAIMQTI